MTCIPHTPLNGLVMKRGSRKRKRRLDNRGSGLSMVIVAAIIIAVGIAAGIYFFMYSQGMIFSTIGSAQYTVALNSFSENELKISIRNIGQVAITELTVKILDGITKKKIWSTSVDLSKTPVKQGQVVTIDCSVGYGCMVTISGYEKGINLSAKWPPNNFIAGRPYIVAIEIKFANGQVRTWTTQVTATS